MVTISPWYYVLSSKYLERHGVSYCWRLDSFQDNLVRITTQKTLEIRTSGSWLVKCITWGVWIPHKRPEMQKGTHVVTSFWYPDAFSG